MLLILNDTTIMILKTIAVITITSVSGFFQNATSQINREKIVSTHIRIYDKTTNLTTPAMVHIVNKLDSGKLFFPGSRKYDTISKTKDFYKGISFSYDKNWSGPVRKMNGLGDNDDRSFVYELMPSLPYWKESTIYQVSGDFLIDLYPGEWQISIEHGNEFLPLKYEFIINNSEITHAEDIFIKRWIDLPKMGWYAGDVHVHHPTDKKKYRDFLLEYAKAEDIHLVNVLEMGHHQGTDFKQIGFGKDFRICEGNICLVSGQEDPRSEFGHIIGLNISNQIRLASIYNYYDTVFKLLHNQQGALVGYAHFSWNGCELPRGLPWYITTEEIDFVELLQFGKINTLNYYDYLNLGFRLTAAAGSDLPWGSTLGEVRTFVYTGDGFSADNWFAGLKAGNSFVSNGPVLFFTAENLLPGTEIKVQKEKEILLKVKAHSPNEIGKIERVILYSSEGKIFEKINESNSDSVTVQFNYRINESQWIAAVVYCENGAVAHTTPIYVIADNQPIFNKKKAPEIINTQLNLIDKTKAEEKVKSLPDSGIILRLDKARMFYEFLLKQVE